VVVYAYETNTWEAEAGGLQSGGQPGLHKMHARARRARAHTHTHTHGEGEHYNWKMNIICPFGIRYFFCQRRWFLLSFFKKETTQAVSTGYFYWERFRRSQALMSHAYNSSYLGGSYQEDFSLKSARANSWWDPVSTKPITKKGLVEWLKVKAMSSNPSTAKKKKKI
jgi:hypothetical protein